VLGTHAGTIKTRCGKLVSWLVKVFRSAPSRQYDSATGQDSNWELVVVRTSAERKADYFVAKRE